MVKLLADVFFALEAIEEEHVGFHLGMRDFDRDGLAGIESVARKIEAMPLRATSSSIR